MQSGLYRRLVDARLIIEHDEMDVGLALSEGVDRVIRPALVPMITYPYEWCFSQLRRAALLVLRLEEIALEFGMTLKDASAYNVQFRGAEPLLIDTLSFEIYDGRSPWKPYLQFCRHFLAPLSLMRDCDARVGQLLRAYTDGIPLDLACSLLPLRSRLRPRLLLHLFVHARAERTASSRPPNAPPTMSRRSRLGLIDGLTRTIEGLRWTPATPWSDYGERVSYSEEAARHKKQVVTDMIAQVGPREVWDVGANDGTYSRIASAQHIPTVAWDGDYGCVELNYRRAVSERDEYLLPVVTDLTNPSPAIGWAHAERQSLQERCRADLLLALAFVHHLIIAGGIPFARVASFFSRLAPWLIVEFIDRDDPRVSRMLATRGEVRPYTSQAFEDAFGEHYHVVERVAVRDSRRSLYLMKRRG